MRNRALLKQSSAKPARTAATPNGNTASGLLHPAAKTKERRRRNERKRSAVTEREKEPVRGIEKEKTSTATRKRNGMATGKKTATKPGRRIDNGRGMETEGEKEGMETKTEKRKTDMAGGTEQAACRTDREIENTTKPMSKRNERRRCKKTGKRKRRTHRLYRFSRTKTHRLKMVLKPKQLKTPANLRNAAVNRL